MNKLQDCRVKIDLIDEELIKLFEKRMDLIKEVILFKKENNISILDSNREAQMLENNLNKISNIDYKKYYEQILKAYLDVSKKMQKDLNK